MEGLKEIVTLWGAETRRTLRSVRAVILLALYALFTLLVVLLSSQFTVKVDGEQALALEQTRLQAIAFLFSADPTLVDFLKSFPVAILFTFKATLAFLPFYVAIIGYDQLSGEIGPKSIRYLTVRARRSSILIGKYLAQQTVLLALALVVDLGLLIFARIHFEDFEMSTLLLGLVRLWVASAVFSMAYAALTALCSAAFRQPMISLVMNLLLLVPLWPLSWIPSLIWSEKRKGIGAAPVEEVITSPWVHLRALSPWSYVDNLLHPQLAPFALSVLAYAAFAAVFLGIAYAVLRRTDL